MSGRLAMSDSLNDKLDSLQRCVASVREADKVPVGVNRTASSLEAENSLASRQVITRPVLDYLKYK
jgi:hypothetical protein